MANRFVLAAVLALGLGVAAFAATDAAGGSVTVKGLLQEDKNGFFLKVDEVIFDIRINDQSKADVHKFYTSLQGDMVNVTGVLRVEEVADKKPYVLLYANGITRVRSERVAVAQQPVVVEQPVVVREVYVERPRSHIDVPFVHIGW